MRLSRATALTLAVVATAALGVSVASALVETGDPAAPQSLVAVPGSAQIDRTAPDPGGGPDWAVRLYPTTAGRACAELGRLDGGRFGRVDPDGEFLELEPDEGGTCGDLGAEPVILAIGDYPAGPGRAARTVLFGRVSPDVASIRVTPPGAVETQLQPGPGGAFLEPRAGSLQPTAMPVRITLTSGEEISFDWR